MKADMDPVRRTTSIPDWNRTRRRQDRIAALAYACVILTIILIAGAFA